MRQGGLRQCQMRHRRRIERARQNADARGPSRGATQKLHLGYRYTKGAGFLPAPSNLRRDLRLR